MSRVTIVEPDAQDHVIMAVRDAAEALWDHIGDLTEQQFTHCVDGLRTMLAPYHDAHAGLARADIMSLVAKYEPKRDKPAKMEPWTAPVQERAR